MATPPATLEFIAEQQAAILAQLRTMQDDAGAVRAATMDRLDQLQNSLIAIRDDIAVNFGTAEAAQRANDNTRAELRALAEVQSAMVRQITRMQSEIRELRGEP